MKSVKIQIANRTAVKPVNSIGKLVGLEKGFTFIELMIVIAIVGIIAAIGFPSYASYVQQSRRADGHLALLNVVQSMERCKSTRFSYAACTIPPSQSTSPEEYYTIAIGNGLTATTFNITATAQGAQESDVDCSVLTIDEVGDRLPANCW